MSNKDPNSGKSSVRKVKSPKRASPKKKKGKPFKWGVVRIGLILFIWASVIGTATLGWYAYDLPDIRHLKPGTRRASISLLTTEGQTLAIYGETSGRPLKVEDAPTSLLQAIFAIEDHRFYDHWGLDFFGLLRAFYTNIREGRVVQGGSTLTQQLAKNVFLSSNRSIRRKVQEVILAFWLEHKFTKDQILSIYLNRVYLGRGAFGFEAAAQTYFNKPVRFLTLLESAVLAGLLKAPSRYSPASNPELALKRAKVVLMKMVDVGFISEQTKEAALDQGLQLKKMPEKIEGVRYFTDWIVDELPLYVSDMNRDLVVVTTLDPPLQKKADKALAQGLKDFKLEDEQVALLSMSPDGAVRAMVGGNAYGKTQFNRATQALRQSGSIFKFFVYLAALEAGLDYKTPVKDGPVRFGNWRPKNYGWKSRGEISLKDAFAYSVNTAAVRFAHQIKVAPIKEMANRLGVKHPMADDLTMALGSSDVTLLELTGAFSVVSNGGYQVEPYGILQVRDRSGVVLYKRESVSRKRLLSSHVAQSMDGLLNAVMEYGTGKGGRVEGLRGASKTGTSQSYRDAWYIGYTSHLTTGIWMGHDLGKPMNKITGGKIPARLWKAYMQSLKGAESSATSRSS
ncbi:MAG: PBP1A family penicillin-binding protein [Alphaproteobacteria bacterium]|nr:PBP1A family penicillin-binding protein [Alphaproteobacteria bacterium]